MMPSINPHARECRVRVGCFLGRSCLLCLCCFALNGARRHQQPYPWWCWCLQPSGFSSTVSRRNKSFCHANSLVVLPVSSASFSDAMAMIVAPPRSRVRMLSSAVNAAYKIADKEDDGKGKDAYSNWKNNGGCWHAEDYAKAGFQSTPAPRCTDALQRSASL